MGKPQWRRLSRQDLAAASAAPIFALAGFVLVTGIGRFVFSPLPLGLLLALCWLAAFWFMLRDGGAERRLLGLGIFAASLLLSALCAHLIEGSYDGSMYHLPSALFIHDGWDPVREPSGSYWTDLYPNAAWTIEAALTSLFGSPSAGYVLAPLFLLCGFATTINLVAENKPELRRLDYVYAALAAANPVLLGQMLSATVDGFVAALGLILFSAALLRDRKLGLALALSSMLLLINIKSSGIYYAVIFCAGALLLRVWRERARLNWPGLLVDQGLLLAGGLIAIFLIGFRPYVTNWLRYGTPVYPPQSVIMGNGSLVPQNMVTASWFEQIATLIFGRVENGKGDPLMLKWPGSLSAHEILAMDGSNFGGGFGPLFSLGFVLALVALVWCWRRRAESAVFLTLAFVLFAACLAFPVPWWARYVPFVPGAIAFAMLGLRFDLLGKNQKRLSILVALVFSANALLISGVAVGRALQFQTLLTIAFRDRPAETPINLLHRRARDRDQAAHYFAFAFERWGKTTRAVGACPAGETPDARLREICMPLEHAVLRSLNDLRSSSSTGSSSGSVSGSGSDAHSGS
jgi:hypothetical protein